MELVLGGLAAVGAGLFSNPLEVVKIRMQLQGELKGRGHYAVHYKNVFHAAFTLVRKEGILSLQKGLVPALWYQFIMNGSRLGSYHMMDKQGWTRSKGKTNAIGSITCGATAGIIGAVVGSPLYLIKTHLQSRANESSIAVGHQHNHKGMTNGLMTIYKNHGILGLWRGTSTQVPRVAVASAIQMLTYESSLDLVRRQNIFKSDSWLNACAAAFLSGGFVAFGMCPFDLIATRFYNQGINQEGKGIMYKSAFDCAQKIFQQEGFLAFFKGASANYFRIGPHTLLVFIFWDRLKYYHNLYENEKKQKASQKLY